MNYICKKNWLKGFKIRERHCHLILKGLPTYQKIHKAYFWLDQMTNELGHRPTVPKANPNLESTQK
jgi:hypothetical protein